MNSNQVGDHVLVIPLDQATLSDLLTHQMKPVTRPLLAIVKVPRDLQGLKVHLV